MEKDFFKRNIFSITNLILVLGFLVTQAKWQQSIDSHVEDVTLHMSLPMKYEIFVPRQELEVRLTNIEHLLKKIEDKI